MKDMSQQNRTILAAIAIGIGLFLVLVVPTMVQHSLDSVLDELLIVVDGVEAADGVEAVAPQVKFESGFTLFSAWYPIWRALCFIAGITLLTISPMIREGKDWTAPVALTAYMMPSIGGMFMFLPYVSWVEGSFPIPIIISMVGLAGFWATLLLKNTDRIQKLAEFGSLTFIGMLATHNFVIGIGSNRMLMTYKRMHASDETGGRILDGIEWSILTMTGNIVWMAMVLLMIAIPLIIMRKEAGWWLALIGGIATLAIDAPAQLIRTSTLDYLYGSLLAIGLLFFLLYPKFKVLLFETAESDEQG